ncbi:MAG: hypothetical protein QM730_22115 [Anaerolineales bacterium]
MSPANNRDIPILFTTRIIRLFCYGFLSVILALYLVAAGLTETSSWVVVHVHSYR